MWPSGLTWAAPPAANGLSTDVTLGSRASPPSVPVIRSRAAAEVTGPAVWNTTWATSPAWRA